MVETLWHWKRNQKTISITGAVGGIIDSWHRSRPVAVKAFCDSTLILVELSQSVYDQLGSQSGTKVVNEEKT